MIQTLSNEIQAPAGKLPISLATATDGESASGFEDFLAKETTPVAATGGVVVLHSEMMSSEVSLTPALPSSAALAETSEADGGEGLSAFLADLGSQFISKVEAATKGNEANSGEGEGLEATRLDAAMSLQLDNPTEGATPETVSIVASELVTPNFIPAPGSEVLAVAGSGPAVQDPKPSAETDEDNSALWPDLLESLPVTGGETPAIAKRSEAGSEATLTAPKEMPAQVSVAASKNGEAAATQEQSFADASKSASEFRVAIEVATKQLATFDGVAAQADLQPGGANQATETGRAAPLPLMPQQSVSTARPEWPETFVRSVQAMPVKNGEKMTIALTPERLGAVQIQMEIVEGVAHVSIVTETPEAAKLFVEQQQRLADLMARNGVEMGGQTVSSSSDQGTGDRQARQGNVPSDTGGNDAFPEDETQMDPVLTDMVRRRGLVDVTA